MSEDWIELRDDQRGRLIGRLNPLTLQLEVRRDRRVAVVDLRATAAAGFTIISSTRMIAPSELKAERGG